MATTVSDFLIERLIAWGVRRIYGYPGDGINGIIAAIDRHDDTIDFIQVRHEEQAAFMACAHAKFTGELGVCLATSGPGAIHLLNGLYDAKNDHTPVLAITGQSATTAIGSEYQQEVDLQNLYKDVASEYVVTLMNPAQVRHAIDRAVRGALSARTVTALIFPKDVQEEKAVEHPPHAMSHNASSTGIALARMIPPQADLAARRRRAQRRFQSRHPRRRGRVRRGGRVDRRRRPAASRLRQGAAGQGRAAR